MTRQQKLSKKIRKSSMQKKHLGLCMCMCNVLILVMTRVEKGVVAVPSQSPDHPLQLQNWQDNLPHGSLQYQLPPSACRKAQLEFHCLWWCLRLSDHFWPVSMADCCLCTTPYWSLQAWSRQQSACKLANSNMWATIWLSYLCFSPFPIPFFKKSFRVGQPWKKKKICW